MKHFIALFSIALIVIACGEKDKTKSDSNPKIEAHKLDGFKIAYYNNDSIKEYFEYYKREDAAVTKKQKAFQAEIDKRSLELQNYVQRKDQEARSGLLSQNEIALVQQKAQQMESNIMQYQQTEGAKLEAETDILDIELLEKNLTPEFFSNCLKRFISMREDWNQLTTQK